MTPANQAPALRSGVLAASLLHDLPLAVTELGVRTGPSWDDRERWCSVPWPVLDEALNGADPASTMGRLRLRDWLRARHAADQSDLRQRVVALALPRGHALHPGPTWGVEPIMGGVLDLGLGLRHPLVDAAPRTPTETISPLPTSATADIGLNTGPWWAPVLAHRDEMARLAVDRLTRDGGSVLRPIGGCDVLTLLSSPILRRHLAQGDGTGMRAVGAPMRNRGWFDLARIDPAFVTAAAMATEPEDRGVLHPLFVTNDEICAAPAGNSVTDHALAALADPARSGDHFGREVFYR